jgi:hypothetical protein
MRNLSILFTVCILALLPTGMAVAQATGEFRSAGPGNWDSLATWETYSGSAWGPALVLPDTTHLTTVRAGHAVAVTAPRLTHVGSGIVEAGGSITVTGVGDSTVRFRVANGTLTVNGLLKQTGAPSTASPYAVGVTSTGTLVIAAGGTFQQDQNGGQVPQATWADGSTFLVTGLTTASSAGAYPGSFYNLVWNCPGQTANANPGFNPTAGGDTSTTIRGDVIVLHTGLARAQLTGPPAGTAGDHTVSRISIEGNIRVLDGSVFSAHGTSSAYTDVIVTVLGNITVRDSFELTPGTWRFSQLAISRGSQALTGTTTWFLKGDSITYGRKTTNQNSTDPNTGTTTNGKFVFCKPGTQYVTLDDSIAWTGKCNMQFGDSTTVTVVEIGNSPFIGSACQQRIRHNATVVVGPEGYIGGGTNTNNIPSDFAMEPGAGLVIASQNGIRATGAGSSGAVRVSGIRDYGTASDFGYNGSQHQRLGSGFPASAKTLTINNPEGVFADSVAAFTLSDGFVLNNGDFALNGCTVTLGPAASLAETPGNLVTGTSGVVTTTRTLTAPPLTDNIAGLGISIGSAADLGSTVLTRGHATQTAGGSSITRYFDVTPATNTGLNATLRFRYDESELNGTSEPTLALYRSTDGGASWTAQGGALNTALNTIELSGLDGLSRWTAAGDAGVGVSVQAGWNMIANPVLAANDSVQVLFPSAAFPYAFAFNPASGYVQRSRMLNGVGYWEKFDGPETVNLTGGSIQQDTIDLVQGWNMIGGISVPVDTSAIAQVPPGIVVSQYFGYAGGYSGSSTIQPGNAYWVKASAAGQLILGAPPARPPRRDGLQQTGR